MNNLVINSKLTALIINDQDPDTATAVVEAVSETAEQAALIQHRQTLLDVARLGHGNNAAVIADVEHAVLLEHGAEHVLHHNRWTRVADEARLLMQLLAEQVDTEVAVLAGLSRGGNAYDLARTALQDQQVTNADVVAWDGDGVGQHGAVGVAGSDTFGFVARSRSSNLSILDDYVFLNSVLVVMMMTSAVDGMQDAVSCAVKAVAEGMVVPVFVVISHINLVLAVGGTGFVDGSAGLGDLDVLVESYSFALSVALSSLELAREGTLVLPTADVAAILFGERGSALAEVSLGDVKTAVEVDLGGWSVTGWVLAVVGAVLYVELGVGVAVVGLTVAVRQPLWLA